MNTTNKTIYFLYGDEFNETDIQYLIAFIRKQPPEVRKESIQTTKMLLSMQQMEDKFQGNNEEPSIEEIQELFNSFISFFKNLNEMNGKLNSLRYMFVKALKEEGTDITG